MQKEAVYSLWTLFIIHVVIASIANLFFLIINLFTYPKSLWFHIPLLVWSFILILHYYLNILLINGVFVRLKDNLIERLTKNAPK